MRIAFFSDNFYPELSGISDSIVTTARELGARGHKIHFYVPNHPKKNFTTLNLPYKEIDLGKNVKVTRLWALPYKTGTSQGRALMLTGLRWLVVRKFNPDVIHVHLPFGAGIEGLMSAKVLHKPLVGTNHTPMREFVRYSPIRFRHLDELLLDYTVWFYNRCDFMSSPAHNVVDEMTTHGFRRPFEAISNPIDVSRFHPRPLSEKKALKRKYGLSDFAVLYAGRMATEKRIDLMIHAVAKLVKRIPDINYVMVGYGPDRARLENLTKDLGVSKNVKVLGFIEDQKELSEVYSASDVFTIMSTAESQSIVAMQAMASGIPVVASKIWGLAEYVNDKCGILIEEGKEDSLPDHILRLFNEPALRDKLGVNGERRVKDFAPPVIAEIWEKRYQTVVAKYNSGR